MVSKTIETDAKGIPLKGPVPDSPPVAVIYLMMNSVFGAIGLVIAWFWAYSSSNQQEANEKIAVISQYDLGWLYLGILVLRFLQIPLYIVMGQTRKASKVHVPDQHVYKVMGAEGSKLGYVLMDTEGVHGDFNRAQRAWQNYLEQLATLLVFYMASSWVFPFEAFVCATLWAISRIMSANGYKSSSDGRMGGLILGTIPFSVLQGMIIIVILKTLGDKEAS